MRKALSRRRELSFTLVSIVYSSRGFSTNKASSSAEASTRSEAAQSIDPKTGSRASAAASAESASFTKFTSQASRPQRQSVLAHLRQRRTIRRVAQPFSGEGATDKHSPNASA
jgi:hypothetical protein